MVFRWRPQAFLFRRGAVKYCILIDMYSVGIDIGASKILGVVADVRRDRAHVVRQIKVVTPKARAEFLHTVYDLMVALVDVRGPRLVRSMGIAVAGVVDAHGKIQQSPNMPFLDGFDIQGYFAHKIRLSTKAVNDARAFLLYSLKYGTAKGHRDVVGVVLGSGVGGAIAVQGEVLPGAHDSAGEVGHMIMDLETHHGRWNVKSLEALASIKALHMGMGYAQLGDHLGVGLANIVNILDPELIVIGGGLASAEDLLLVRARNVMAKYVVAPKAQHTPVLIEKHYEIASAVGATL